jgi:hypothetical protein
MLLLFLLPGGDLLSQDPAVQVPSTLESLTSVFGMGTGVASPSLPPDILDFVEQAMGYGRLAMGFIPAFPCFLPSYSLFRLPGFDPRPIASCLLPIARTEGLYLQNCTITVLDQALDLLVSVS